MKTKSIEFAYPSSTNSKKFGFYNTGCYTVEVLEIGKLPKALKGFATRNEAKIFANTLPYEYNEMFLKCNVATN